MIFYGTKWGRRSTFSKGHTANELSNLEAFFCESSSKKEFLKISQISQENNFRPLKRDANTLKFLRTPFFTKHLWWLLLLIVVNATLLKIFPSPQPTHLSLNLDFFLKQNHSKMPMGLMH